MRELAIPVRSPRQLGHALQRLRLQRGLNQAEAGRLAGLRQATVSSAESGAPGTELATVFALLAALGGEIEVVERVHGGRRNSGRSLATHTASLPDDPPDDVSKGET